MACGSGEAPGRRMTGALRGVPPEGSMYGYTENKDAYIKRLRRIEGQIRGRQRMVEDDK